MRDQARVLVERLDLLDGDRLEVPRGPDLVHLVVVAGHDVLRLRLREDDLPDAGRVLDGELQLDPGVRLLVGRLDLGDQVDAEADDADRALVGRGRPVTRARLRCEERLGREGCEARECGAPSEQLSPVHPVVAHSFSVSFRKWSNPNFP